MMRFALFIMVFLTQLLDATPLVKGRRPMRKSEVTRDTALITPWTSFTESITATGTYPMKATSPDEDLAHWRRVGDTMEINYVYYSASSAGAADGSGLYLFSIPPGFTIDTTKVYPSTDLYIHSIVGTAGNAYMWVYDATHVAMMGSTGPFTYAPVGGGGTPYVQPISSSYQKYVFNAKVPISGWSARRSLSKGRVAPDSLSRDTVTITNFTAYDPSINTDVGLYPPTWDPSGPIVSYWRRVGDSMDIIFSMYHSAVGSSTSGTGTYYFSLPSGYFVDATKMPLEGGTPVALVSGMGGNAAVHGLFQCFVFPYVYVGFSLQCGGASSPAGDLFEPMGTAPVSYRFMATVPILGWGT